MKKGASLVGSFQNHIRDSPRVFEGSHSTILSLRERLFFSFFISLAEFGHGWKSLKIDDHDILRKGCKI
jgi:hypothetical protein